MTKNNIAPSCTVDLCIRIEGVHFDIFFVKNLCACYIRRILIKGAFLLCFGVITNFWLVSSLRCLKVALTRDRFIAIFKQ